jgi:hypothetical protein
VKVVWIYKGKYPHDPRAQKLMADPRHYLATLSPAQLQELLPSALNFQRTEQKLDSHYLNYWRSLHSLVIAILAEKTGESAISEAFRAKVDDILAKPHDELLKMQTAIQTTLASRGGSGEAFWKTVQRKIEERTSEMGLINFYKQYQETHRQEENQQELHN